MFEKSCEAIVKIDREFSVNPDDSKLTSDDYPTLNNYCPLVNNGSKKKCKNYEELVSFYNTAKNRINNLNDYYNTYIKENLMNIKEISSAGSYNSYNDIINNKIQLEAIGIKEMSEIYGAFEKLCNLYTECNKKKENYTSCSQDADDFVKEFQKINDDFSITGNDSYREILSSLSTNYNNFKNDCVKKCSSCNNLPTLSAIKTPQSFEHASSSSSIASTLIPVLLTFTIPFFLGVAYKYSLFGFDKRLQKHDLRKRLKK
ncbi:Plasmodium variant antigen protein Cir/Yir/Bir, putative [Plasmodium chabaudi adami]|uniref:Plasmodium variant antigen protein Cir/Yir/Bir, putative n=1 Tax=Plasmodium chabaudi adami TaxID=5826 RepID=A0A1D3LBR4_PLACE|nr:Plasmodium variant antigen protein Cir/Yir/Bir, putative [Plasmodium chabaudi adami]